MIGGNGAGKTTLLKHILGLLAPTVGTRTGLRLRSGCEALRRSRQDWVSLRRKRSPKLDASITELMRYTQAFYPKWDEQYAEELRVAFELDPKAKIKTLSRGQRQTGLLVALAHRPEFFPSSTNLPPDSILLSDAIS